METKRWNCWQLLFHLCPALLTHSPLSPEWCSSTPTAALKPSDLTVVPGQAHSKSTHHSANIKPAGWLACFLQGGTHRLSLPNFFQQQIAFDFSATDGWSCYYLTIIHMSI
ncbi:unnamed protein product [Boreogadus saida]